VRHSSLPIFPSRIKTYHDLLSDIRDKKNFFIFPMIFYFAFFYTYFANLLYHMLMHRP
jgi:hypothetical protein